MLKLDSSTRPSKNDRLIVGIKNTDMHYRTPAMNLRTIESLETRNSMPLS